MGAGAGISIPHVDALSNSAQRTYGYQLTGPALRLVAGYSQDLNTSWALFGEYQFTASWNSGTLNNGGTFKTGVFTNALNLGIAWNR